MKALVLSNSGLINFGGMDYDYAAALDLVSDGYEVFMSDCRQALPCCRINVIGSKLKCLECQVQRKIAASLFPKINQVALPKDNEWELIWDKIAKVPINDEKDLINLRFDNLDLGFAAVSTAYNLTLGDCLDMDSDFADLRKTLKSILFSYLGAIRLIREIDPDLVIIWNGRMSEHRAHLRAAEACGKKYRITEVGSDDTKWHYFKNYPPHSRHHLQEEIKLNWVGVDQSEKVEIAHNWFRNRRNRKLKNQVNWAENQEVDYLPKNLTKEKKKIVIFTSTWREFVGMDDWKLAFGHTQFEATTIILEELEKRGCDFQIIIRLHPNQENALREKAKFMSLGMGRVVVIAPLEKVDTYALIDAADVVITFGSTVGIEATYWGKPSILCGPSLYD